MKLERFIAVGTMLLAASCVSREPVDLIITGGTIYTLKPERFYVQSVAVNDGRVVYAGEQSNAMKYRGPATRVLDLDGGTMLPGLVDAHAHLMNLGNYVTELQLVGTTSAKQIREMTLTRIRSTADKTGWIEGRGWDQNDWDSTGFPTWRDLAGTEQMPVYLRRVDGHAGWLNKTALERCGIDASTPDPPGGELIRDAEGNPTGIVVDKAMDLVRKKIPKLSRAERKRRLLEAIRVCRRFGLTGIHDGGVKREVLEVFDELESSGELGFRVYCMLDADEDSLFALEAVAEGPRLEADAYVRVGAVKHYADGALGSRGALLLEDYADRPGHSGLHRNPRSSIEWWTRHAMDNGFQMCVHAIGDAGNRMVIDVYEKEIKERGARNHRLRIEHAQVLALEDIERVGELGIVASMQPTHCTSDLYWVEERLGPERVRGAYAWRKFIDAGAVLVCGSDFPVEGVSPLWGIYAAVTREDRAGWPEGGWHPEECLSREEAVRGFTTNAAYAEFTEHVKGTIERGNLADFTVFDRDILEIPAEELLVTQVTYTIVGGEVVFDRAGTWEAVTR
jgi:predicted amidohydrolase YtcJ